MSHQSAAEEIDAAISQAIARQGDILGIELKEDYQTKKPHLKFPFMRVFRYQNMYVLAIHCTANGYRVYIEYLDIDPAKRFIPFQENYRNLDLDGITLYIEYYCLIVKKAMEKRAAMQKAIYGEPKSI